MVGYSHWMILLFITVYSRTPLAELVDNSHLKEYISGQSFCHISQSLCTVGIMHGFVGGVGIALMRMIFIKNSTSMRFKPMSVALAITASTLAFTLVGSYFWEVTPKPTQNMATWCLGIPTELERVLFHLKFPFHKRPAEISALIVLGFSLILSELAIYTSIYVYLIQHNKMMRLVLAEDIVKKRIRKNVIDLTAHMMSFMIEIALLIYIAVMLHLMSFNGSKQWVGRCLIMSTYGVLGAIHIGYSLKMRQMFIHYFVSGFLLFPTLIKSVIHTRNILMQLDNF